MSYQDAALRHWTDSSLLDAQRSYQNSDHLIGLAAECAIKVALMSLSGFTSEQRLTEPYKTHINVLWNGVAPNSLQRSFPGLAALLQLQNPFSDWHIDQRYAANQPVVEEAYVRHREVAKRLLGSVGLVGQRRSI